MSRFCALFSSSRGNSTYLSGGGTELLVDAGVSLRQLAAAMAEHGVSPKDLQGVLVTHEHIDHIRGLAMLLKKYKIPLYASQGTLQFLMGRGDLPPDVVAVEIAQTMVIGAIQVTPFDTPHDAKHSMGFRLAMPDGRTLAIATDLGHVTETVRANITGCDLVMLESNYDKRMLECSPYPYGLKRRILGDLGHLDNEVCARECVRLVQSGTTRLVLSHLSEQNNLPALARETTKALLDSASMRENKDYLLSVAPARGRAEFMVF